MQTLTFYAVASETVGEIRDYANAKTVSPPSMTIAVETQLNLRLFKERNDLTPYPVSNFSAVAAWKWVMDSDFDDTTPFKIVADNSITVNSLTETIDGESRSITEIRIPISNMNTVELSDWLGTSASKTGLYGELTGYNSAGNTVFVLQIEKFTVRNRITSTEDPTENTEEYLTEAQTRALIAGTCRNALLAYVTVSGHTESAANGVYTQGTDYIFVNSSGYKIFYEESGKRWLVSLSGYSKGQYSFERIATCPDPPSGTYVDIYGTSQCVCAYVPPYINPTETF